jgi:hypothetical protein
MAGMWLKRDNTLEAVLLLSFVQDLNSLFGSSLGFGDNGSRFLMDTCDNTFGFLP